MKSTSHHQSEHFARVLPLKDARTTARELVTKLKASGIVFDTIAFCGLSGAVIAPVVALRMNKEMLMIRKNGGNDGSNSLKIAEGHTAARNVLILDDLVSSGRTIANILSGLRKMQEYHLRYDSKLGYAPARPLINITGILLHTTYLKNGEITSRLEVPGSEEFQKCMKKEGIWNPGAVDKPPMYQLPAVPTPGVQS